MRLGILFSGGMNSVLAMHWAARQGHSIDCIVSVSSPAPAFGLSAFAPSIVESASNSFQLSWIPLVLRPDSRSQAMDLGFFAKDLRQQHGIDGLVAGFHEFSAVTAQLQFLVQANGLSLVLHLLGQNPGRVLSTTLVSGFKVIPTRIFSANGGQQMLGQVLDASFVPSIASLPTHPFPIASTLVVHGPGFGRKLRIAEARPVRNEQSCELEIKRVDLETPATAVSTEEVKAQLN